MIEMGKILKCFRKEKQLAMKQICTGICSVAMLSGYESGKYTQSFLLFERRTNNPPLQMRGALSGGYGGFLCQLEMKAPTDKQQSCLRS